MGGEAGEAGREEQCEKLPSNQSGVTARATRANGVAWVGLVVTAPAASGISGLWSGVDVSPLEDWTCNQNFEGSGLAEDGG